MAAQPSRARAPYLTKRELLILRAYAAGMRHRDIAVITGLSPHVIRELTKDLRRKLGAKNIAHAVAIAFRLGILG